MKFKIISLGCKVNSYECAAIRSHFLSMGFEEAKKGENVDVALINTCSVTATADQKSRQQIRKLKKMYPNAIVVVMGCYSQKQHNFIKDNIQPDIIVGTSNRHLIPELVENALKNGEKIDLTQEDTRAFKYEELGVIAFSENVRAYLKIQDGCNNFCSYCIIPFTRGVSRSRQKERILDEAKELVKAGYKEIVLTGIHVGGYGTDLNDYTFADLVEELSDIPGLYRLRISSIEESEISDKLIELIKNKSNIAKHLHIPLQSGSDTVLKRMNRKYTCEEFLSKLKKIRQNIPDIALTTDVIVGFPQESEQEANETKEFIKACDFNMLHVFPFSSREGTVAHLMKGQVDPTVKNNRVQELLSLSKELWDKYTSSFENTETEILIEEFDEENGVNKGHNSNFIHLNFKNNENLVGKIVKITIKKCDVI